MPELRPDPFEASPARELFECLARYCCDAKPSCTYTGGERECWAVPLMGEDRFVGWMFWLKWLDGKERVG